MQSGEMRNKLACFGSFHWSLFLTRKNKGQPPLFLKFQTYHYTWAMQKCLPTFIWSFRTQFLTFWVLTEPFKQKNALARKIVFDKYSAIPSGLFWQWCPKLNLFLLPDLVILLIFAGYTSTRTYSSVKFAVLLTSTCWEVILLVLYLGEDCFQTKIARSRFLHHGFVVCFCPSMWQISSRQELSMPV